MSTESLKLGNNRWGVKEGSLLAYNDNDGIYGQLPFNVNRESSATYIGRDGLLHTAANNVPRIDFSDDPNGVLLTELQSTNLITYSEDFSQWSKSNSTASLSGDTYLKEGSNSYILKSSSSLNSTYKSFFSVTGSNNTFSVFVKNISAPKISLKIEGTIQISGEFEIMSETAEFNFTGSKITSQSESIDVRYIELGGGWYRLIFTYDTVNVISYESQIILGADNAEAYLYGGQVEALPYATSYIPTNGSTATRLTDSLSSSLPSDLISNDSFVWYTELTRKSEGELTSGIGITSRNSSGLEQIRIHFDDSEVVRVRDATNSFTNIGNTFSLSTTFHKLAISVVNSIVKVYLNGVKIGSDYNAPNIFSIDKFDFYGKTQQTKDLRVFNTALTDEQLIKLTS